MKMNKEVVMVRLSDIIPNRFQPRLTFDEEALNELSNSIKEHGIIQPLILRDLGSKYEIIAGERRYKASTLAGLTEVPAIIGSMDDQTSAELALIENIQRKDLTAIEEAKSYKKILDMGNFTQEELAKRMGKSQSTVANKMRLLSLTNEVQMALMNNLISERHARCLLQIKDDDKQKEVLNKIITDRMNVRDTDDYIKNMLGIKKEEIAPIEKEPVETNILENPKTQNVEIKANISEPQLDTSKILESTVPSIDIPNNTNTVITSNDRKIEPSTVKSALGDLNVVSTNSKVFGGNNLSVEEKDVPNMENIEIPVKNNELSKIKLATAIRLVKDSVEEIKKAGYNVTIEELEEAEDYKITIKVQK